MLCQLNISNYAIVRFLELEFSNGMTSITGETGAGKSIAIDALGLCLGNRADANSVRPGASKTEISASFSVVDIPAAKQWLVENDLELENDCILRRTISQDGRSRAYINGNPVPLTQLKSLGQLLVAIHGQHAHHAMLKSEHQLTLLDSYANHKQLIQTVSDSFYKHQSLTKQLKKLSQTQQERDARKQLLQYQVEELDEFALQDGEYQSIEIEHKKLANGTQIAEQAQALLERLQDSPDFNLDQHLNQAVSQADGLSTLDPELQSISGMLNEALIQVQESSNELQHYISQLEFNPELFQEIEQRMSTALQLSRKHQVTPQLLFSHHQQLKSELDDLSSNEQQLEVLQSEISLCYEDYARKATKLHKSRQRYAKELNTLVTQSIQTLNMPKGKFFIEVNHQPEQMSAIGSDGVEFMVTTNPGLPLQPIAKVASGGELSRIGLGIQVITAQKVATPTLIFDEVDVGISGPTASVVGKMLRSLGDVTQVFCVTHLPQVAGNGHQHMFVDKQTKAGKTETSMQPLSQSERISELARLLGGDTITDNTLANAKELLCL
ncbi:DNA repair protein RecN [Shewanella gelidii]|uniref:DNA repair protein RecN n=2 Tax=Shewanella gelidii TaxID=1642821 RepID=A0A917N7W5_9GAMM|nr:DNA repair protein RecN [Shewanella gelidii]MCL1096600.1 DNA repair protein RecN [Shewanella gelidii]GGI68765.1 DNA repair protein RecN [Shewanella gelidii]